MWKANLYLKCFLFFTDDRPSLSMYPSAPGRGGKRGDIHRLGILLWTLYQVKYYLLFLSFFLSLNFYLDTLGKYCSPLGLPEASVIHAAFAKRFNREMHWF